MKIMRKLGAVFSAACTLGIVYFGVDTINQAQASQNAIIVEQQRLLTEVEARRFVADVGEEQLQCLARNIFFEARDQDLAGQVAVAWVTLNRVDAARYPDTICGVVQQAQRDSAGNPIRHQCQFSWYCDGLSDRIPNNPIAQRAWEDAQLIAEVVLLDYARGFGSPVEDATMYHADYVDPYWTDDYDRVATIGDHIFYR
jgi:spore germination cell wall hydrolase CwlJ-like protein